MLSVSLLIARRVDADESTISKVIRRLMSKGLLDVGPDAWGWSYRVIVSAAGKQVLKASYGDVVRAAAASFGARRAGSQVRDGGAAEGLDGDFGEELGVREDADVGEVGLEELADVATDVGLGKKDDR